MKQFYLHFLCSVYEVLFFIVSQKDILPAILFTWQLWYTFFAKFIKGTLMEIEKSPYKFVFIQKQYLENFAFLILTIHELLTHEVCKFLKKWANY